MWQLKQLRKFLEEHKNDIDLNSQGIFLTDPEKEQELDDIIVNEIWPGVVKAISQYPLTTRIGINETVKQGIYTKQDQYIARELVFIIDDPERPRRSTISPPWFCRERIECTPDSYMISSDFTICFPDDFSLKKVMRILREPKMQGCPPELSYSDSSVYKHASLNVSLRNGNGTGWGLRTYSDAREHAYSTTMKNIQVINSVAALESNYEDATLFNNLRERILDAYEAY